MVLDPIGLFGEAGVKAPPERRRASDENLSTSSQVPSLRQTTSRLQNNMAKNPVSILLDADPPPHPISIGSLGTDTDEVGCVTAKTLTLSREDSKGESSRENPPIVPSTHNNSMIFPIVNDNHDLGGSAGSFASDKPRPLKRQVSSSGSGKKEDAVFSQVSPIVHKRPRISTPPEPIAIAPKPQRTILLARPADAVVLNPLHAFVRQQIEVFTATERDITQPAPGRKNPVSLHQIGLRCIHCRDLATKQKVKRAVCYPSSVGRVYHSVSDMKHDHFKACPGIPEDLRRRFLELKDEKKSKSDKKLPSKVTGCSSSTAQYYHDSACEMGMTDGTGGIFWNELVQNDLSKAETGSLSSMILSRQLIAQLGVCQQLSLPNHIASALSRQQDFFERTLSRQYALSLLAKNNTDQTTSVNPAASLEEQDSKPEPPRSQQSSWMLACPMDIQYLNPIHCFVRRHVEVFVAGHEEVNAPSPGRKVRVVCGQVGIRCIHCSRLTTKDRVKRSSCYPPSIGGLYHAVSNMKNDHFALCKGLPAADREEFLRLRDRTSRKTPKHAKPSTDRGFANSTAQYYHDSALRMGLVDTADGIRLGTRDAGAYSFEAAKPKTPASESPKAADGIAALVIAATDLISVADDGGFKSIHRETSGDQEGKEQK